MIFKNKNLLLLHFIVLIWGWSPILGKLINIEGVVAYQLVWFRMLITVLTVASYLLITKTNIRLPKEDVFRLIGIGAIIAFHWFCFYNAINVSNVSVTFFIKASVISKSFSFAKDLKVFQLSTCFEIRFFMSSAG